MNRNERITIIVAISGLIVTACGCIAAWLVVPQFQQIFSPPPSVTALPSNTPSAIPSLNSTSTSESSPTDISPPTNTPYSTNIPKPRVSLPFQDDFETILSDSWQVLTGTWRIVNGQLTADPNNNDVIILIGDKDWTNYVIDVDVYKRDTNAGYPVGVIVRANNGNYLIYQWSCCDTDWILVTGTSRTTIAHLDSGIITSSGAGGESKNHIHVEVNGQTFTGSVDGKLYLTVSDPNLLNGRAGLTYNYPYQNTFRFDQIEITAP